MTVRPSPRRLRDERGSFLIEAIFAATLLVAMGAALWSTIDGAILGSSRAKARSIAATLAEQDQERMRGLPATALSNYHPAAVSTPVGGVTYLVKSRADWVYQGSQDQPNCTSDTAQPDYIKLTSTVTSPSGASTQPVTITGLTAPPVGTFTSTQGTVAIKIVDRSSNPVPDVLVTLSGAQTLTDTTNSAGCAIFNYLAAGSYTATVNQAGWMGTNNTQAATVSAPAVAGKVSSYSLTYDQAATANVSFVTPDAPGSSTTRASTGTGFFADTTGPPSQTPVFAASPSPAGTVTAKLFPFSSGYSLYAGTCSAYKTNAPTTTLATTPGGTATVTVKEPSLLVKATNKNSVALNNATVTVTSKTSGCTGVATWTTLPTGYVSTVSGLYDAGLPAGSYDVKVACGSASTTSSNLAHPGTGATTTVSVNTTATSC